MAELLIEDVRRVFHVWDIMFPSRDRTKDQCEVLERSYYTTLAKRLSREAFFICCEMAQTETTWLPKIADILKHKDHALAELARKRHQTLPLPRAVLSDEEAETGLRLIAIAKDVMFGKTTVDEGLEEMRKIQQPFFQPAISAANEQTVQ